MRTTFFTVAVLVLLAGCTQGSGKPDSKEVKIPKNPNLVLPETDHKLVVYQMMTRLFGNKVQKNTFWGTAAENGVGKFNDINETALQALRDLGITHVWYTGVLEHALMADYTRFGIPLDDADVVKGRAGSPYAIKDYYDVNPDLAVDVKNRKKEFKALIDRTHAQGLKVIIDFVPNHVARKYQSDAKPKGVKDLGEGDDTTKAFSPNNDFYYLPGTSFKVPEGYDPLGSEEKFPTEDGSFKEVPAKVTGNDQFTASPGKDSWFETVKLNYGVDIQNGRKTYFDPVPATWQKMKDILVYWAKFGVDGFRCDMAEMVPVEFWAWAIPQVKAVNPEIKFIAEIYNPAAYERYIEEGKFDYLYDKVGLYDAVKPLIKYKNTSGNTRSIYWAWTKVKKFPGNMLAFLENHDEQRVASKGFSRDPWYAVPGMVVSATLYPGPVMIYFGQEVGEPGDGKEGFQGNDGRTTIFDYWGVPEHQKWLNNGKFDGGGLSEDQKKLRATYARLLKMVREKSALRQGNVFDLNYLNTKLTENFSSSTLYAYLRYTEGEAYLIVANFQREDKESGYKGTKTWVKIPQEAWDAMKLPAEGKYQLKDIWMTDQTVEFDAAQAVRLDHPKGGISLDLAPYSVYIFHLTAKP